MPCKVVVISGFQVSVLGQVTAELWLTRKTRPW